MGSTTQEPRTINDVGLARKNGLQQEWIFLGIVFQVGVLDQDDVPRGRAKASPQSCALALIRVMKKSGINHVS